MKKSKKLNRTDRAGFSLSGFMTAVAVVLCAGLSSCDKDSIGDLKGTWEDASNPGHRIKISGSRGTLESIGSSTSASYAPFIDGEIKVGDVLIKDIRIAKSTDNVDTRSASGDITTRASSNTETFANNLVANVLAYEQKSSGPLSMGWEGITFTLNGNSMTINYEGAWTLTTGTSFHRVEKENNKGNNGGNNSLPAACEESMDYWRYWKDGSEWSRPSVESDFYCRYARTLRCERGLSLSNSTLKEACDNFAKVTNNQMGCIFCD